MPDSDDEQPDSAEESSETTGPALAELLSALLASDLALELDAEFSGRVKMGWDVPAATQHALSRFQSALTSPQEGPIVLVALAALQVRESHLQTFIRDAAIDLIDTGEALNAYRSFDSQQRKAVREMLERFQSVLETTNTFD